jgi:hypothetical protein
MPHSDLLQNGDFRPSTGDCGRFVGACVDSAYRSLVRTYEIAAVLRFLEKRRLQPKSPESAFLSHGTDFKEAVFIGLFETLATGGVESAAAVAEGEELGSNLLRANQRAWE